MKTDQIIAIYGATGFTGGLVARQLAQAGFQLIISGRNQAKLERLAAELRRETTAQIDPRPASVDEPKSLDRMLEGAGVLINCAGPFGDVGPSVVEAAVRNAVHYLDTTGEQAFIKLVQRECSVDAKEKGVVLMPGCAYEYAVGAFAARLAIAQGARRIAVCYVQRNTQMSPGTRSSILRAIADPGYTFIDGALSRKYIGYRSFEVPRQGAKPMHALWFPGGEPILAPLMSDKLLQVETCLAVNPRLAKILGRAKPLFRLAAGRSRSRELLDGLLTKLSAVRSGAKNTEPGTPIGDARPEFLVTAFDPQDAHFYAAIIGGDAYEATARIISEAARRLLKEAPREGGFTSPAALFEAREFLAAVDLEVV